MTTTTPDAVHQLVVGALPSVVDRRAVVVAPGRSLPIGDDRRGALLVVVAGRISVRAVSGVVLWFDTGDLLVLTGLTGGRIVNDTDEPARLCFVRRADR